MPYQLPAITIEDDGFYHVDIPADVRPTHLAELTINPAGIYTEAANGDWDLITWNDMAEFLATRRAAGNLNERILLTAAGLFDVIGEDAFQELAASPYVIRLHQSGELAGVVIKETS